jgi:hypothetical protein
MEEQVTGNIEEAIMAFIDYWVRSNNTAVPKKEIMEKMLKDGIKTYTTLNALNALIKKRYIRKGHQATNRTVYVQLRTMQFDRR